MVDTKADSTADVEKETPMKPAEDKEKVPEVKQEEVTDANADAKADDKKETPVETKDEIKQKLVVDTKADSKSDVEKDTPVKPIEDQSKVSVVKEEEVTEAKADAKADDEKKTPVETKEEIKQEMVVDTKVDTKEDTETETPVKPSEYQAKVQVVKQDEITVPNADAKANVEKATPVKSSEGESKAQKGEQDEFTDIKPDAKADMKPDGDTSKTSGTKQEEVDTKIYAKIDTEKKVPSTKPDEDKSKPLDNEERPNDTKVATKADIDSETPVIKGEPEKMQPNNAAKQVEEDDKKQKVSDNVVETEKGTLEPVKVDTKAIGEQGDPKAKAPETKEGTIAADIMADDQKEKPSEEADIIPKVEDASAKAVKSETSTVADCVKAPSSKQEDVEDIKADKEETLVAKEMESPSENDVTNGKPEIPVVAEKSFAVEKTSAPADTEKKDDPSCKDKVDEKKETQETNQKETSSEPKSEQGKIEPVGVVDATKDSKEQDANSDINQADAPKEPPEDPPKGQDETVVIKVDVSKSKEEKNHLPTSKDETKNTVADKSAEKTNGSAKMEADTEKLEDKDSPMVMEKSTVDSSSKRDTEDKLNSSIPAEIKTTLSSTGKDEKKEPEDVPLEKCASNKDDTQEKSLPISTGGDKVPDENYHPEKKPQIDPSSIVTPTIIHSVPTVQSLPANDGVQNVDDASVATAKSQPASSNQDTTTKSDVSDIPKVSEENAESKQESQSSEVSVTPNMCKALTPTETTDKAITPTEPSQNDIVTETVTIVKESIDSVTKESSIGNAGIETKLISTSTISQQVTESEGSVTATATIDSAIFEEVTNKGKKVIDESLEKVQVHMAKVVELEHTDLASAEAFEAIGQCVTQITEKTLDAEGNVIESKTTTVTKPAPETDVSSSVPKESIKSEVTSQDKVAPAKSDAKPSTSVCSTDIKTSEATTDTKKDFKTEFAVAEALETTGKAPSDVLIEVQNVAQVSKVSACEKSKKASEVPDQVSKVVESVKEVEVSQPDGKMAPEVKPEDKEIPIEVQSPEVVRTDKEASAKAPEVSKENKDVTGSEAASKIKKDQEMPETSQEICKTEKPTEGTSQDKKEMKDPVVTDKEKEEKVKGPVGDSAAKGNDGPSAEKPESLTETKSPEEKVASWGKPLGLPSPMAPPNHESNSKASKERSSRSDKSSTPVYMDLAYVPCHGDAHYSDVEFFKRVRARYYVFSGVEPSREVFDALLEGKKSWENKELGEFCTQIVSNY